MVLVSACSERSGSVVAPEPNIQISFDRNTTSTRPKATVSLGTDHSVSVAASGHQMTIKGNTGLIDGKYRVRFTKETADMIESGISEIENQQTVASHKLQQAAEQCAKRGNGHLIGSPTIHAPAAQASEDPCIELGLAYLQINQMVNNFWDNFWSSIAYDMFKEGVIMLLSGSIELAPAVYFADVATAYVEYNFLKIDRAATAQEMRNQGCV